MLTPINRMAWRKSAIARGEIKALPSPAGFTNGHKQASALLRNWISLIVHRVQPMASSRFYDILRLLMARISTARSILPDFTMRVSARK
jgi:hypothetical protein